MSSGFANERGIPSHYRVRGDFRAKRKAGLCSVFRNLDSKVCKRSRKGDLASYLSSFFFLCVHVKSPTVACLAIECMAVAGGDVRLSRTSPNDPGARNCYAIWSSHGRVGKSTLCFHLSTVFAEEHPKWKVLVCDMSPQADVSTALLTGCTEISSPPAKRSKRSHKQKLSSKESATRSRSLSGEMAVDRLCHTRLVSSHEIYQTAGGYIQSFVSRHQSAKRPAAEFVVQPSGYNSRIGENVYLLCGDTDLDVSAERLEQYRRMDPTTSELRWSEWTLALRDFISKACDEIDRSANWAIFIDTASAMTTETQLALAAADHLIVPVISKDHLTEKFFSRISGLLHGTGDPGPSAERYANIRQLTFARKAAANGVFLPKIRLIANIEQPSLHAQQDSRGGMPESLCEVFKSCPALFFGGNKIKSSLPTDLGTRSEDVNDFLHRTYVADLENAFAVAVDYMRDGCPLSHTRQGSCENTDDPDVSKEMNRVIREHRSAVVDMLDKLTR